MVQKHIGSPAQAQLIALRALRTIGSYLSYGLDARIGTVHASTEALLESERESAFLGFTGNSAMIGKESRSRSYSFSFGPKVVLLT